MGQSYSVAEEEQAQVERQQKIFNKDPLVDVKENNKIPNDPRSPTPHFRRTPIRLIFPKYGSTTSTKKENNDPRSPNKDISRTPLRNRAMLNKKDGDVVQKLFAGQNNEDKIETEKKSLSPKN